jgi:amidophosphoribosyltransferase
MDTDEIRSYLNVDTLTYLTLDRLVDAVGAPGAGFCTACLTGEYPVEIPAELGKGVLEGGTVAAAEGVTAAPAALLSADERALPSDTVRTGADPDEDRTDG